MNLWTQHETRLEELRQAIPGGPSGWVPERLIYRDWWHWRDAEIGFAHGRLALTGQNAGGKSSLLALAIPTLLDGDTTSIRLDPAQSRDRHLAWYLLGDDDVDPGRPEAFRYEARTGYLAFEFRDIGSGAYVTIGMGVSASRDTYRRLRNWWGFVLPGKRLGRDFDVRGPGPGCREFKEFAASLPPEAFVTTERREYRRKVNELLFGMSDDDYQALIDMLLQARRPKLGEQSGPEKVCALLRDALPSIPTEQLDRVAEVVDNIEQYQRNLEDVAQRAEKLAEIDGYHFALAEVLVQESARQYQGVSGQLGNVAGRLKQARAAHAEAIDALKAIETRSAERGRRRTEIAAQLDAYRLDDRSNLPTRVVEARQERVQAQERHEELATRVDGHTARQRAHEADLSDRQERFRIRSRGAADDLRQLARVAEEARWAEAARELERAARDLESLRVTSAPGEVALARPSPSLGRAGEQLADTYRRIAGLRTSLDEAVAAFRREQDRLSEIEGQRGDLLDRENQAERDVEEAKENLIAALEGWRDRSEAFPIPDSLMGDLAAGIRGLDAVPGTGAAQLIAPLRRQAVIERGRMEHERLGLVQEEARAEAESEQLERAQRELRQHGLLPPRSPLRVAARADTPAAGLKPLFAHVRFKSGVDEDIAVKVEAAALEAGLLDLLLLTSGGETSTAAADAWFVPNPTGSGPTLREVLEPEPGAPADVTRALESVGFGEGEGQRWITADGRWRNGAARGQVGRWVAEAEAAGLVGEERRAAALETRLAARHEAQARILSRRDGARLERERLERALAELHSRVDEAERAPWQAVFDALSGLAFFRSQVDEAEQRVAGARLEVDRVREVQEGRTADYQAALHECPAASGLDARGLVDRRDRLQTIVSGLQAKEETYGSLEDLARWHLAAMGRRDEDRRLLQAAESDLAEARERLAAVEARLTALEEVARDPEVAALASRIGLLEEERSSLEEGGAADARLRDKMIGQQASSGQEVETFDPQEAELRDQQVRLLGRLKGRLLIHPRLAELADALERESPVAVIPRLPKPVEPEALEQATNSRRALLQDQLHRNQDALGDYRPTPDDTWETIIFHYEGVRLTASVLYGKLTDMASNYRQLIAEEEQELYQRIILHGILEELRQRIHQARRFTDRTNSKLRELTLSNREQLSLRLRARDEKEVPGAGIAKALESMDQGSDYLPEDRREYLITQVKGEIDRVRREAQARDEDISYLEAINKALDYREWFEYQLLSRQPGSASPAPIRNRGFGQRSTSAKAWALAVPIIAGVAARYDAAGQAKAPRLIALDEAFAGFDTNNQVNYLKFLGDLGLCWIVTSPDELAYSDALSAAMAYRLSLEGNLHTPFPLLWDGKTASEPLSQAWANVATAADDTDQRP